MNRMFIEPERATRWHAGMGKPANVRAGGVAVKPRGIGRVGVDWERSEKCERYAAAYAANLPQ